MGNSVSVTKINQASMVMIPKWANPQTVQTVTSPLAFYINAKIMITKQTLTQLTQLRVTARNQEMKEYQTTLNPLYLEAFPFGR